MFVITADQRASRDRRDLVPEALSKLFVVNTQLPFERTVGDEIQGVPTSAEDALWGAMLLFSTGGWHVGVGAGKADLPLAKSARESGGEAFYNARRAVEEAKLASPSLVVVGSNQNAAKDADALWRLLASVWERRTAQGWEAVLAMRDSDQTQAQIAKRLNISQQALSQRLQSAMWQTELAVHPLACRLLERAANE